MFHVCCLVEAHEQLDEQKFLGVVAQLYYVAPIWDELHRGGVHIDAVTVETRYHLGLESASLDKVLPVEPVAVVTDLVLARDVFLARLALPRACLARRT